MTSVIATGPAVSSHTAKHKQRVSQGTQHVHSMQSIVKKPQVTEYILFTDIVIMLQSVGRYFAA